MGIVANYRFLSDKDLKELQTSCLGENITFEDTQDLNDNTEILLDVDKMWDALHFVLTGVSGSEPIKNDPLSEAVMGVYSVDVAEEFIAYTEKSRIKDILFALDNFDIDKTIEKFSMSECKKANVYANIWDYEEESDEIKEELTDYFHQLKDFYKKISAAGGNVMVSIG